jgi:NADH dehydrogenase FAD-containing subunit
VPRSQPQRAGKIAVVGGGAVGVQLAADIKSFYNKKEVVLVHSRERLLPTFGNGNALHEYIFEKLRTLRVKVILGERPVLAKRTGFSYDTDLLFKDGRREMFDLVVGKTPSHLSSILPPQLS